MSRAGVGRLAWHLPSVLFLIGAAAFVFRDVLLFGYRFIGHSDRWDQYLPFVQFHVDNLSRGRFSAWSENLLGGFDTLTQPFTFPSPEFLLPILLGTDDIPRVFSYVALSLLVATLLAAYWAISAVCPDRLASTAGACIYGFATYGLLKLAQNHGTYLTVLLCPLLFRLTRDAERQSLVRTTMLIAAGLAAALWLGFLQELTYLVLFLGSYGLYALIRGRRLPLLTLAVAGILAAWLASPRLLAEVGTFQNSSRIQISGIVEEVEWRTAMRYLDRDIFGLRAAEPPFFPFEGNLLFASTLASLLLIAAFVWWLRATRVPGHRFTWDLSFMFGYVAFVFLAMHSGLVYRLVKVVFLNQGLLHTRIGFSAMLPVALISADILRRGREGPLHRREWFGIGLVVAFAMFITVFDFESIREPVQRLLHQPIARFKGCETCVFGIKDGPLAIDTGSFLVSELLRLGVLAVLGIVLATAPRFLPGRFGRGAAATSLALAILFQSAWGGGTYFGGPQARDYRGPFEAGELVLAPHSEFRSPTFDQRARLADLLENDDYRSVVLCPRDLTKAACSNTLGLFWNVRMIEGYLAGVPLRLASLGWTDDTLDSHTLRFEFADSLPWRILSFLNVRQAVVMNRALYVNDAPRIPEDVQLVPNPSAYVYPRAYFAQRTQAVDQETAMRTVRAALAECAGCPGRSLDAPLPVDYVEGPVESTFDASGPLAWESAGGDSLSFTFPPSASARFLVANESYAPGWTAYVDGKESSVYPTNVVMRGVLVPPAASRVDLVYRSFLQAPWTFVVAVGTTLVGLVAFAWALMRRRREQGRQAPLAHLS